MNPRSLKILAWPCAVAAVALSGCHAPLWTAADLTPQEPPSPHPPMASMPDLAALAARAMAPPSSEQLAEEAAYKREQALAYAKFLDDPNADKRMEAVERLGTYPSREAENALSRALRTDADAAIRQRSAQILGDLGKITDVSVNALLAAVTDRNADVQHAALLTLESLLTRSDTPNQRQQILNGLKRSAHSTALAPHNRAYAQELRQRFPAPQGLK